MSRNRVIGRGGAVPWHLPEDLRWFKRATSGQAVLMGRRTFESIGGQPLPDRLNLVATRGKAIDAPGVVTIRDLAAFRPEEFAPREVWVVGGAEVYARMLPRCSELYLSIVDRDVEAGDAFFPSFEEEFPQMEVVFRGKDFEVRRYERNPAELPSDG